MKKFIAKFGTMVAALALMVATVTANSTCVYHLYQDEMPEKVKSLSKVR